MKPHLSSPSAPSSGLALIYPVCFPRLHSAALLILHNAGHTRDACPGQQLPMPASVAHLPSETSAPSAQHVSSEPDQAAVFIPRMLCVASPEQAAKHVHNQGSNS